MRIFYLVFTKSNTFESTDLELEMTGNESYQSFDLVYFSDYPALSKVCFGIYSICRVPDQLVNTELIQILIKAWNLKTSNK